MHVITSEFRRWRQYVSVLYSAINADSVGRFASDEIENVERALLSGLIPPLSGSFGARFDRRSPHARLPFGRIVIALTSYKISPITALDLDRPVWRPSKIDDPSEPSELLFNGFFRWGEECEFSTYYLRALVFDNDKLRSCALIDCIYVSRIHLDP